MTCFLWSRATGHAVSTYVTGSLLTSTALPNLFDNVKLCSGVLDSTSCIGIEEQVLTQHGMLGNTLAGDNKFQGAPAKGS